LTCSLYLLSLLFSVFCHPFFVSVPFSLAIVLSVLQFNWQLLTPLWYLYTFLFETYSQICIQRSCL